MYQVRVAHCTLLEDEPHEVAPSLVLPARDDLPTRAARVSTGYPRLLFAGFLKHSNLPRQASH